jgi:hypothetical protein
MAVTFTPQSSIYLPNDDVVSWQNKLEYTTRVSTNYPNRALLAGNWYLNWALWIELGGSYGESATAWKLPALFANITTAQLTPVFPLVVPLVFVGGGANQNNNKITAGQITFTNPSGVFIDIKVELWHFIHSDYLTYQTGSSWNNIDKFLKNSISAPSILSNTSPAAYNFAKISRLRLYVEQTSVSNDVSVSIQNFNSRPRWYNSAELAAVVPGLTFPTFILSRTAGTVTNLSTVEDTKVKFSTVGNYSLPHFILLRTDITDQSQTQVLSQIINSGSLLLQKTVSYAQIPALTPPTFQIPVTNTAIKAPTALVGLNSHFAHIDRLQLDPNGKYRIIAVVTTGGKRYAFHSNEFTVDSTLPIFPPTVTDYIADVESEKTTNWLNTAPLERVRSRLVFNGAPYNVNKPLSFADALVKITVTIYKRQQIGSDTYTHILKNHTRLRNVLTAFNDADDITVNISGQDVEMYYTWRNRNDAVVPNIDTLLNGFSLAQAISNQDWNNNIIYIEWRLEISQPSFTDVITRVHRTDILDFSNNLSFAFFDPTNPVNDFICDDVSQTKMQVTGGVTSFVGWLIRKDPFTVENTEEEDTFAAFAGVPALDTLKYANSPAANPAFVANVATAYLTNSQLLLSGQNKVGVIYKKITPCAVVPTDIISLGDFVGGNDWRPAWASWLQIFPSTPYFGGTFPPVYPQTQTELNAYYTGTSVKAQISNSPAWKALFMMQAITIKPACCYELEVKANHLCSTNGTGFDPLIFFFDQFGNLITFVWIYPFIFPVCPAEIATTTLVATFPAGVLSAVKYIALLIDQDNYPFMTIDYVKLKEKTC